MTLTATTAAAAAGIGLSAASGHADSVSDIEAQVTALDQQAEQATNVYDGAMEQMANLQKQIDAIQGEAATAQQSMNTLLATLGPMAAAQYRSGSVDPTLELMLSNHPESYLQQASVMDQVGQSELIELKSLKTQQVQLSELKKEAADRLAQLQQVENQAAEAKNQIVTKFRQAQGLLAQLTYTDQQSFGYMPVTAAQIAGLPQVGGRAGIAIAYAKSKIGMWYQWGGEDDPSFDCSGLVQASYAAAGISLPRITYDQVNSGYPVPAIQADLEPGDLIFYAGNEHVAIYVGNGLVVHAPETGKQIGYAPWNMMSISGIRRVV
jgi:cell wall-associated NlpC family hydrolase